MKLEDRTDLIKFLHDSAEVLAVSGDTDSAVKVMNWATALETAAVVDKVYAIYIHGHDIDGYSTCEPVDDSIVYTTREAAKAARPSAHVKWVEDEPRGPRYWDGMYSVEEVDVVGYGDEEDK